ncbi:Alkaline ceramidase 3 [Rhizoclosmatium hyalinum]|nr:Alkaline ceramidase 3 [Rhizoclosmatium hyalinum]
MGFGLRAAGNDGHWGPVTSTLDWCEENYVITPWIAEFWNSTSNIFYVLTMIFGLQTAKAIGVTEWRTYLSMYSITAVGLGSFLFHASLWFETQMMDELPMIYGCSVFVFACLRVFPETNKNNTLLAVGLAAYCIAVTAIYLYLKNPVFHEVSYAILAAILFITPPIQYYHIKNNYKQYAKRVPGLWKLYWFGAVSYLGGFAIWGIDNNFCEEVRATRAYLGFPLSIFFQLHMFWHLGTAIGTYASILGITYTRQLALGRDDIYLHWIAGIMPTLKTDLNQKQLAQKLKKKKNV